MPPSHRRLILPLTLSCANKGKTRSCHLPTGYFIYHYLQYVGGIGYRKPNSNSKQSMQQSLDRTRGNSVNTACIHNIQVQAVSLDCNMENYGN